MLSPRFTKAPASTCSIVPGLIKYGRPFLIVISPLLTAVTIPDTGDFSPLSAIIDSSLTKSPFLTDALPFTGTTVS